MSTALELLSQRKQQLEADIDKLEKTIYNLETEYLAADYSVCGTVLKGFEGFLSSKDALRKRARTFRTEDRSFSLSSRTSPATAELEQNLLELVDNQAVPVLGRGKGYASKGIAHKGQMGGEQPKISDA
ncbi:hypothetical protein WJX81_008110 [Elliptochloris bilobata]|uniref:Chromatin modification-related protein MEAF6 n=1 Tax=Elliptochloris bilobata TaxID=381761 RepID=A0AAW1QWT8_9CHLO